MTNLMPFLQSTHRNVSLKHLSQRLWQHLRGLSWGVFASALIAYSAIELGKIAWLQTHGLSALTLAIVLGMLLGNTVYPKIAAHAGSGVTFSKQSLLRVGIIFYGFRLTMHDIGHVGLAGVLIDASVLTSTFALAWFLGTRVLKLDRNTALLIGAGSSICGAAAVMATEPIVRGKAEQVTVAISTVVLFGTLAIFLYPALYDLNMLWGFIPAGSRAYGIFAGSTIHEVAQVVAAAHSIGSDAADTAVIAKMVRVMMLAPFLIGLSVFLAREKSRSGGMNKSRKESADNDVQPKKSKLTIPWFAFAFVAVVVLNSFAWLPQSVIDIAVATDTTMLAMAMAALGLTTHVSAMRQAGIKPLLLGATLFAWLIAGGAAINTVITALVH